MTKNKKNKPKPFDFFLNAGTQNPKKKVVQLKPVKPLITSPSFSNFIFTEIYYSFQNL